jgi:hypothetical protein
MQQTQNNDVPNLAITSNAKILESDYQKYITDVSDAEFVFLASFAGYRKQIEIKEVDMLGEKREIRTEKIVRLERGRLMNEEGATFLFNSYYGLISKGTQTSKLTDAEIYNLWNAKIDSTTSRLLKSYYIDNNPFELEPENVPEIITILLTFYPLTKSSSGGFKLRELAESFITTNNYRMGIEPKPRGNGIIDTIKRGIGVQT